MWWVDLMVLVEKLDDYEWAPTDENIACLVDREDYWLNSEYTSWVTDPEDPEVQRARDERKKQGIKPPDKPVLFPVAHRPPHVHQQRWEEFSQRLAKLNAPAEKRTRGSIRQLREAIGR